jgi:hypothetical protein
MNANHLVGLSVVSLLLIAAALAILLMNVPESSPRQSTPKRAISTTNPLAGHPHRIDRLVMADTAAAFDGGNMLRTRLETSTSDAHVVLSDDRGRYPRSGYWTSPDVVTDFPFTEVLPSWNAITPPDTGIAVHVQTRDAQTGEWSPLLYIGQWGRVWLAADERDLTFDHGTVHVDNLLLDRPANAYRIRVKLQSFSPDEKATPRLRRVAVAYSGRVEDDVQRKILTDVTHINGNWARDLDVPFRWQTDAPKPLDGMICSPTSVTMVMAYHGIDLPTIDNAMAIYDYESLIFGNWGRAVQRAGEMGLDAWLQRFSNWDQVKALIARGQPLIVNIKFKSGEFPSNVMKQTSGHLIVIRGFTPDGDVICNDPASRERGNGVVYKADELGRAWFENSGGVGYVIRKTRGDTRTAAAGSLPSQRQ